MTVRLIKIPVENWHYIMLIQYSGSCCCFYIRPIWKGNSQRGCSFKLDLCLTVHHQCRWSKIENQQDATITIYWSPRSAQHISGKLLPIFRTQDTIPYAVKNLSLALLKMGKSLPETCLADLGDQQNCYCCILLVFYITLPTLMMQGQRQIDNNLFFFITHCRSKLHLTFFITQSF